MSTHPSIPTIPIRGQGAAVPARRQGPLDPYEGEDEDPQVRLDLDLDSDPNWDFDGYRVGPDGGMVAPSEMTKSFDEKEPRDEHGEWTSDSTMSNKFAGKCAHCNTKVEAGQGVYDRYEGGVVHKTTADCKKDTKTFTDWKRGRDARDANEAAAMARQKENEAREDRLAQAEADRMKQKRIDEGKPPMITRFNHRSDSGEYGNDTCAHCGAKGRYQYHFDTERGPGAAMAGCIQKFPVHPLANEQKKILDKASESSDQWGRKGNDKLNAWDKAKLDAIEQWQNGKITEREAKRIVDAENAKRKAWVQNKFGGRR